MLHIKELEQPKKVKGITPATHAAIEKWIADAYYIGEEWNDDECVDMLGRAVIIFKHSLAME